MATFEEVAPMFSKELVRRLQAVVDDAHHPLTKWVPIIDRLTGMPTDELEEVVDWENVLFQINQLWHPLWFGEDQLFIRDPCQNYYRDDNGDVVRSMMACLLVKGFTVKSSKIKNTIDLIVNHVSAYPFGNSRGYLNFVNGMLDTNKMCITECVDDVLFDYVIDTPYVKFTTTPELDAFLAIYGDAGREVISVTAKSLWQRCYLHPVKEITVFYGDKDSGKTGAAELIQATLDGNLLSQRNTSRKLLGDLLQRFGYQALEHKLLNIGDDLPDQFIRGSGKINEFVGSVHHDIEHKGVDSYSGLITAYNLFTTNNLPPLDDDDFILWSKIRLTHFKEKLSRGTPVEPLYTPLVKMQLLYRAVEMMMSWKEHPYVNPQTPDEVRTIWHEASTDVELFIATRIVFDESRVTSLADIKSVYEKWCIANGKHIHVKYLTKRLQSYLRRTNSGNGYAVSITAQAVFDEQSITTTQ